jgi:hypothetical protein
MFPLRLTVAVAAAVISSGLDLSQVLRLLAACMVSKADQQNRCFKQLYVIVIPEFGFSSLLNTLNAVIPKS